MILIQLLFKTIPDKTKHWTSVSVHYHDSRQVNKEALHTLSCMMLVAFELVAHLAVDGPVIKLQVIVRPGHLVKTISLWPNA